MPSPHNHTIDNDDDEWTYVIRRKHVKARHLPTHLGPDSNTSTNLPRMTLSKLLSDDSIETMRRKHSHAQRSLTRSLHIVNRLQLGLEQLVIDPLGSRPSVDILCLGLGNPAVDRASLRQLTLIVLLCERFDWLKPASCRFYDPLFRQTARQFIRELGMQVITTNQEGCYQLKNPHQSSLNHYHLIILPHCPPALLNNLLRANWSPNIIGRFILFTTDWRHSASRSHKSFSSDLPYLSAVEPSIQLAPCWLDFGNKEEPDFEGMRLFHFPHSGLSRIPKSTWSHSPLGVGRGHEMISKDPTNYFYSDLIQRTNVPDFVED